MDVPMKPFPLLIASTVVLAMIPPAGAQSTINTTAKYAYGANTGWLDFRPSALHGVVVGGSILSGHVHAANFGWITLGSGNPANGHSYGNVSSTDIGVNHDGAGNLSGFGYSGNIGWITFGWAGSNDPNRPRVDLITGQFSGYVYSANTGWIHLAGNLRADSLACPDSDNDQMADAWEIQRFGGLGIAGLGTDKDKDGQSDAAEYAADTNPDDAGEFLRIIAHAYIANRTEVTITFATTRPTRTYQLQSTTSLGAGGPGGWTNVGTPFTVSSGPAATRSFSSDGAPRRFFRVVGNVPL